MFGRSVSLRLIAFSTAWIGLALLAGGVTLSKHFQNHVEASVDSTLYSHIEELLSFSDVVDGRLTLRRHPSDPDYLRPLSGWYWEIFIEGAPVERSRSLWDQSLNREGFPEPARGQVSSITMAGPRGQSIRVLSKTFSLPGLDRDVTIYVTAPATAIEVATGVFTNTLVNSLWLLGAGLVIAVLLQVVWGLKPLNLMRERLADIHAGRADHMTGTYPLEVEPVVEDLNRLLEHNAHVIERARTHAGNLAHALKTPLAVLQNAAGELDSANAGTVREQTEIMNNLITRHLSRARAAGGSGVPGISADIGEVTSGLKRTLARIYAARGITITLVSVRGAKVYCDQEDLGEMIGNLMDNACKWANTKVRVTVRNRGGTTDIVVDDDGSGVPKDQLDDVLGRGRRLDEATPGSGLGLSIVLELAELYQGSLSLDASELGGLAARLSLPSA